ncbi:MAG: hypothetical protein L6Q71_08550, partial [Planctomycetes bacterium]|nr:hypothetical protein [Planctomycetota bacterium]
MKASDLWNKQTRIIEIAGDDAQVKGAACVAGQLIAAGVGNYLLVCASERQAREALNLVPLKGCVTHSSRPNIATANNADVLIFSGSQTAWLRRYRKLKHAGCIAFTPRLTPLGLLHFLCWLGHIFVGHYVFEGRLRCENAGEARTLLVSRIRKRKDTVTPRRYVPHGLGVRGLFEKLNGMSARYAILRWFENLPSMDEGEDIDMLVADEHIDEVRAVLDCGPGIVPVDCYSASGLPGTQYRKMAYYAPHLARDILEHTMLLKGIFRVPDSRHHFLSLAYHALYHKGLSSGLPPTSGGQPAQAPAEHDYTAALKRLAAESRIDVDISLDALDGYLKEQGWRPPLDTLCKLAPFNPWVNSLIAPELAKPTDTPGLACFIIRRSGFDRGQTDAIVARLEDEGFEILRVKKLNDEEAKLAAAQARGGNWVSNTKPPFWDPPAVAIAAYSLMPKAQSEKEMKLFPHRTDARLAIKERIRDDFTKDLPEDRRPNMLHSSDNSIEAEHYLRWLF